MASLFKPVSVRTDPATGKKTRVKSRKWYIKYTDANGIVRKVPGFTDKTATRARAHELETNVARQRAGLPVHFEEQAKRPVADQLAEFEASLRRANRGKPRSARYVDLLVSRVRRIISECGFGTTAEITALKVEEFLAALCDSAQERPTLDPAKAVYTKAELAAALAIHPETIKLLIRRYGLAATGNGSARRYPRATVEALRDRLHQGVGPQTRNYYLAAVKHFCRWLVRNGKSQHNPLDHLAPEDVSRDRRHDRRKLTPDEVNRLLAAARASGKTVRGLTGLDRFALYATAIGTGFRAAELASLTRESFDLESVPPVVNVPGTETKNGQPVTQPLPSGLADMLRGFLASKPFGQPVWPGTWAGATGAAPTLRIDLEAAGIPYVIQGPSGPLYADFHALRHTFIGLLDRPGITLKQAMQLARHSDPKLTMAVYGKASLADLGEVVREIKYSPGYSPTVDAPCLPLIMPATVVPSEVEAATRMLPNDLSTIDNPCNELSADGVWPTLTGTCGCESRHRR
ncbi:MAG: tyrosine-type recombinase/integrase [Planctomycetia bacterium]|nr:tyrosine-type recombinase/integrase [Planctomycetia bacterium]